MKGRFGLCVATIAVLAGASGHVAAQRAADIPFLFTEDQAAVQSDLSQIIRQSDALRRDTYLNGPMTRLEYMLSRMETALNEDISTNVLKEVSKEGFDKAPPPFHELAIRGYARYKDDNGRVLVGYDIRGVGRPKKPMRTTCTAVLELLRMTAPQENVGLLLHSVLLGVLSHKEDGAYTQTLGTLASQLVHRASITSHR